MLHLGKPRLEAVVEAGKLAAGGGAALRHLGEIGQRVHRAVEREKLLVVLLHLGVGSGAGAERHVGRVQEVRGAKHLGVLRRVVGVGRVPRRIVLGRGAILLS